MIRFLIPSFFQTNLSSVVPLISLVVFFVNILTLGQDKLLVKAMMCVFLGYSRIQMGYRCYSSNKKQCFISADVIFFENSSSSSTERLHVPDVLPLPLISLSLDLPSPFTNVLSRPLQVDTHHPCINTWSHADSFMCNRPLQLRFYL